MLDASLPKIRAIDLKIGLSTEQDPDKGIWARQMAVVDDETDLAALVETLIQQSLQAAREGSAA